MPSAPDKLLLNSGGIAAGHHAITGNAKALDRQFRTALIIGEEIEDAGLLSEPEVLGFRDKLESVCARIDDAQDAYIAAQDQCRKDVRAIADEMRRYFDSKTLKPPTP